MITGGYAWLNNEPGPRMLVEAIKLYGTAEVSGLKNNQIILDWAKEVGVTALYTADEVPWCGLFLAVVAARAGKPWPKAPLWALNWALWGEPGGQPELGDVLVFIRDGGGHVGLYVGEDSTHYHVLGGNTGDKVKIARIEKKRLRVCRQYFAVGKPENVRPIILSPIGEVSKNER